MISSGCARCYMSTVERIQGAHATWKQEGEGCGEMATERVLMRSAMTV